jgi:hypothetical protein
LDKIIKIVINGGNIFMKKILALVLAVVFALTMIAPETLAQKRKSSKYRGWATNIAIIAGSTAAGALIGRGRNGALIGAGAGTLYAFSRKGSKRRYGYNTRRIAKVAGATVLGTGIGAAFGGKKGAIIGALIGAGSSYLYTKRARRRR